MNTLAKSFFFFFLFTFQSGCSPNPDNIINEWKENGWSYVSTYGSIGEVKRTGVLESEKAQAVEAAWTEKGKRKTKGTSARNDLRQITDQSPANVWNIDYWKNAPQS